MSYLVIDFGTSSCRASIVSSDGIVISRVREAVSISTGKRTAEIDTGYVWGIVKRAVKKILESNPSEKENIDAVGVSAMLGWVFLDLHGDSVRPAIIWMDNRTDKEIDTIKRVMPEKDIYMKTGRKLLPELLAPKLLWLKKNEGSVFRKIRHVVGLKDEIVRKLTGIIQTDFAHMNYTLLYNIKEKKIDSDITKALGIKGELFPEASFADKVAGTVSSTCSNETGLIQGIPVISGSSDGTTAMYGGGILNSSAVLVSGTTDVFMQEQSEPGFDSQYALTINNSMENDSFIIGGAMGMSGGTLKRILELFNWDFDEILKRVSALKPGSEGLVFLPGLTGERAPYWDVNITGSITGLTLRHEPEHIIRALFEGTSFRILRLILCMDEAGFSVSSISVVGGTSGIEKWNQIRADVTGRRILQLRDHEATSLGTAIFCSKGIGAVKSMKEISKQWISVQKEYLYNPEIHNEYLRLFEKYEKNMEMSKTRMEVYKETGIDG